LELLPHKNDVDEHSIDITNDRNDKKVHDMSHRFTIETDEDDIDDDIDALRSSHRDNDNSNNNVNSTEEFHVHAQSPYQSTKELFMSKTFWRFTFFTLLLINLKTIFRHLDATLPTYLLRIFGDDVPKVNYDNDNDNNVN
jgi:hypothetical protein